MTRLTLFDYGAGNLHSLAKALAAPGREVRVESDPVAALDTALLVLPGVGAFSPAASRIAPARDRWREAIDRGLPVLGVCLGMQLLFEASDEGPGDGLGVLPGRVTRLHAARTPQIGWNTIDDVGDPIFAAGALRIAYYANSFACRALDAGQVIAWSTHEEDRFSAAVRRGAVVGVQFHPEKSSLPGLRFLDRLVQALVRPSLPLMVSR